MQLRDKVTIVTGAGRGIGAALACRFAQEGARAVFVVDQDEEQARQVAAQCGGIAVVADVTRETEIQELVATAYEKFGRIDLFCSNAGIMQDGGLEVSGRPVAASLGNQLSLARVCRPRRDPANGGARAAATCCKPPPPRDC